MNLKEIVLSMKSFEVGGYISDIRHYGIPNLHYDYIEAITGKPAFVSVTEGIEFPKEKANRDISPWLPELERLLVRATDIVYSHRYEKKFETVREYCEYYNEKL